MILTGTYTVLPDADTVEAAGLDSTGRSSGAATWADVNAATGNAIDRRQVQILRSELAALDTATDRHLAAVHVGPKRCALHRAFDADYCPSCGTSQRIGDHR